MHLFIKLDTKSFLLTSFCTIEIAGAQFLFIMEERLPAIFFLFIVRFIPQSSKTIRYVFRNLPEAS